MPRDEARASFYERIRRALKHLEAEVAAGRIGSYGISSNTFVVPRENEDAVSLERVLENAGPDFAAIQLPFNPLETGAREPIHTADGKSVLEVAKGAGLGVLVNRPLNAFSGRGLVRFAALAPDILREMGRSAAWDEGARATPRVVSRHRIRARPARRLDPRAAHAPRSPRNAGRGRRTRRDAAVRLRPRRHRRVRLNRQGSTGEIRRSTRNRPAPSGFRTRKSPL